MTESEHQEFARLAYANKLILGVEPALARRFFMNHNGNELEQEIGERATVERIIIMTAFCLGWLAIIASSFCAVFAFFWWSIAIIPVVAVGWWAYLGRA